MRLDTIITPLINSVASMILLAVAALSPTGAIAEELSEAEFRKLHKEIRPAASEPWRTIPWKISVLDAQRVAATEKKPLFIWAMDGHPLGCT